MEELKKYLKEIGYSENDIEKVVNGYGTSGWKPETLLDNIKRNYEFFISLGYNQVQIIPAERAEDIRDIMYKVLNIFPDKAKEVS